MKHLLSIDDLSATDIHGLLELTDHMVEISQRQIPKVPALRGKNVVSLFFEDSTRTRTSFDTAAKRLSRRHDELRRVVEQRQQGREPARHDRDDRGDGGRCVRRPPQVQRRAASDHPMDDRPASSTPATAGTSTRRRRCSTATRFAPTSTAATASTGCASRSSATSSTAAWRAATCRRSPRSARTSRWWPRRRCCRRRSTDGRSTVSFDLDSLVARSRRAVPAARAARADGRCAAAELARVLVDVRPDAGSGRRACRRMRW